MEEKKKICLIGCVKQKTDSKNKVRDLYTSPLFKMSLKYAEKNFDEVCVLSAKHGLMTLDEEHEPYEVTLNNMKAVDIKSWASNVTRQILERYPNDKNEFYILAGRKYHKYLGFPRQVLFELPIGKKLAALKQATSE